jgi:CheY-like chemotaxis protein
MEILTAENGIKAVEAFKMNPGIGLILMDCEMPGMNGF